MANADVTVQLNTAAPLDTANPPTARPAGVLIEAQNLGSRWWGPRTPNRADTWLGRRITTGGRQSRFLTFNGSTQYAGGNLYADAVRDLGTTWTVDVWFGLADTDESLPTLAAHVRLNVFSWYAVAGVGTTDASIYIYLGGPNGSPADLRKITARINTTSARGTTANAYTVQSTSQVPVNTGSWADNYSKITHVRLVRNGSDLRLYVNGVLEATTTVHETQPHQGDIGDLGGYTLADSAAFKGIIPRVVVRTSAYIGPVIDSNMFGQCPHADDVRLCVGAIDLGLAGDILRDSSNNHLHAKFTPTVATTSAPCRLPGSTPVQGIGNYVNRTGKECTVAMIGGSLNKAYS